MGTDMHPVVQVRHATGWRTVPLMTRKGSPWDDDCPLFSFGIAPSAFTSRNYALFAVLANVRNDGWPSIAAGRGLPHDYNGADDSEFWEHSLTWLTLSELLAFDWRGSRREYVTALEACWDFVDAVIPWLLAVAGNKPDDLRLLLGFDS